MAPLRYKTFAGFDRFDCYSADEYELLLISSSNGSFFCGDCESLLSGPQMDELMTRRSEFTV